jgi:MFS family permease
MEFASEKTLSNYQFYVLVTGVAVSGLSQGLTMPLLSVLIDEAGYSPSLNGWNAAALYLGMFIATLLVEKPTRKYGYKPMIMGGIAVVCAVSMLIPIYNGLIWWFILRLFIGFGDSFLHYATQLWITTASAPQDRGKKISLYGFAYGSGFCIGPFGLNLLSFGIWAPFLTVLFFYLLAFFLVANITNQWPEKTTHGEPGSFMKVFALGWYALFPAFLYGILEAVLNGNFPVYALRTHLGEHWISVILFAFAGGSLLLQLPLGVLSDRLGRRKLLMTAGGIGALCFSFVPLAAPHTWIISILFMLAGCFVGSFFSLGLAYLADVLPKSMLPTGNVMASMLFSFGSIAGPGIVGIGMQEIHPAFLFYLLVFVLGLFCITGFVFRRNEL